MTEPSDSGELASRLSAATTPTERNLFFAALLRATAGVSPDRFIVVGGSAIEVYTLGRYTSGDIDIVTEERERVEAVLRSWSFQATGRIWIHEPLGLVVDLVKAPYTGSGDRTTLATTPFGPVRLAAPEDLLVKRLSSTRHWGVRGDFEHAKLLALQFGATLDWDYVERFAVEHQVLDLVNELRKAVGR
jgi:hypothetical protein